MNYSQSNITKRAEQSELWPRLSQQDSETLPYLLERYLLLENWRYRDSLRVGECETRGIEVDDIQFLHLLLAEAVTVLLNQEERLRKLEKQKSSAASASSVSSVPLRAVSDIFNQLRFDRETHLGNGDIRLALEKQREILDLLSK